MSRIQACRFSKLPLSLENLDQLLVLESTASKTETLVLIRALLEAVSQTKSVCLLQGPFILDIGPSRAAPVTYTFHLIGVR